MEVAYLYITQNTNQKYLPIKRFVRHDTGRKKEPHPGW